MQQIELKLRITRLEVVWEVNNMASLNECRNELRSIINELRDIELNVRNDFIGIGQDLCGNCIDRIADKYEGVLNRLYRVNQNRLASWIMGEK